MNFRAGSNFRSRSKISIEINFFDRWALWASIPELPPKFAGLPQKFLWTSPEIGAFLWEAGHALMTQSQLLRGPSGNRSPGRVRKETGACAMTTTLRAKGTLISEPRFSAPCEMRFFQGQQSAQGILRLRIPNLGRIL